MKKIILIFLFLLYLSLSLLISCETEHAGLKVIAVIDGDTIKTVIHGRLVKIRLAGIDAPEYDQPFSRQSKKHLKKMVLGKSVRVKFYGKDRYRRILGTIYLNNKDINLEMLKAGLAEIYRGKLVIERSRLDSYRQAENIARTVQKGIWSLGKNYISPRNWRMMKKYR